MHCDKNTLACKACISMDNELQVQNVSIPRELNPTFVIYEGNLESLLLLEKAKETPNEKFLCVPGRTCLS